jgi:hypothetical protein
MNEGKRVPYPGGTVHLDEALLLDLGAGALAGEELHAAALHARACPPCEARLRAWTGAIERLRAAGVPVRGDDGRYVLPELPPGPETPASRGRVIPLFRGRRPVLLAATGIVAAAAAVALLVLPRARDVRPAEAYWIPPVSAGTVSRAAQPEADPSLAEGFRAYGEHRAEDAARRLAGARASGDLDLLRRLYLAGALYNSGNAAAAAETLRALDVETLPEPVKDEAEWLFALSLTASGRTGEAGSWFEKLAAREGAIGERARRRLGISPSSP